MFVGDGFGDEGVGAGFEEWAFEAGEQELKLGRDAVKALLGVEGPELEHLVDEASQAFADVVLSGVCDTGVVGDEGSGGAELVGACGKPTA